VRNVAPGTNIITGPTSGVVGQSLSFVGSFSDVGTQDTHKVQWNFGDSSPFAPPPFVPTTNAGALTPSHVWTRPGTYTIRMTIRDDDGGAKFSTKTIVIRSAGAIASALQERGTTVEQANAGTKNRQRQFDAVLDQGSAASTATATRRDSRRERLHDQALELIQTLNPRSSRVAISRATDGQLVDLILDEVLGRR